MNKLSKFKQVILKGQAIPTDLEQILQFQASQFLTEHRKPDPLAAIGVKTIDPDDKPALLYHSYLNENDRRNPDIMANINAINEVFELITFVAEGEDQQIYGYWQPAREPIANAPIVKFDNEGQFGILSGANLTEAIIGDITRGDSQLYLDLRNQFIFLGIDLNPSLEGLKSPTVKNNPYDLHSKIYQKNLANRQ